MQLLHQFRYNEKCAPTPDFFALQNVAENVIAHIQDILAFGANETSENIAGSTGVDVLFLEGACVYAHTEGARLRVHLSQNRAFAEEQRFSGVNYDGVKIGLPVSVRLTRLKRQR